MSGRHHRRHHPPAGVRHDGRAGIGDEREVFTRAEPAQDPLDAFALVVLMQGHQGRVCARPFDQQAAPPRVLREDAGDRRERFGGSGAEVAEVADRGADEVEGGHAR
jgi:hypothetical protein